MKLPATSALAASLALALVGCAPPGDDSRERVTVGIQPRLSYAEIYIALDRGFFEEEGLEIEILPLASGRGSLPALAQGQLDVSLSGPFSATYINLIERGGDVRLVAARHQHVAGDCGYASFVARRELIETGRLTDDPASIRGLRITSDRTASTYYYWSRLLESGGVAMDEVELHDVPSQARAEALRKGLVDVASATEPWVMHARTHGDAVEWKQVGEILPGRQNTFLLYGRRLLRERRDIGVRFLRAYLRGVDSYTREGESAENVATLARHTGFSETEVRTMCWPRYVPGGRIDPVGLTEFQEWALAEGHIDAIVPFATLVDEAFLDEVAGDAADD